MGLSVDDATQASEVLISADLRGIDSHGVARLSGYVRLFDAGRINVKPKFTLTSEALSAANLNADAALGLVSAPYAMNLAIEKAKVTGVGLVSVSNSNHFGIAAYHAMKALPHDMIGIALTNASPLVSITNSSERLLGTNPICMAFPANKMHPLVIDMSTSAAANGKIEIAERAGKSIPETWVSDKSGNKTTNPSDLRNGGALLPLGSTLESGNHKGYGLGAIVDILSGVISGANFGPWVPPFVSFLPLPENPVGLGLGHFLGAIRVDAFRPKAEYFNAIDTWIERFKSAKPISPETKIYTHGELERLATEERSRNGIPLDPKVYEDLKTLAVKYNLTF